jgi:hypothetical protein
MSESDENQDRLDNVGFRIKPDSDTQTYDAQISVGLTEATQNELEEAAERLGFDAKSPAYRYFLTMGMNAVFETDPRGSVSETKESDTQYDSLSIRDVLPDNKEEALNLKDDEIVEAISEELLDEITNDPKINKDGWNIWLSN